MARCGATPDLRLSSQPRVYVYSCLFAEMQARKMIRQKKQMNTLYYTQEIHTRYNAQNEQIIRSFFSCTNFIKEITNRLLSVKEVSSITQLSTSL